MHPITGNSVMGCLIERRKSFWGDALQDYHLLLIFVEERFSVNLTEDSLVELRSVGGQSQLFCSII